MDKQRERPVVGQGVYVVEMFKANPGITPTCVQKVGLKYFYVGVSPFSTQKFSLKDWRHIGTHGTPRLMLFASIAEQEEYLEARDLYAKIAHLFRSSRAKLSVETLRQVWRLVEPNSGA